MNNTIRVPRDLLMDVRDSTNEAGNLSYRQHHIDHHRRLTRKLDELLEAPAVEVEGLEVIGFHCMDSAGIEALEWRGGSYADEPLCSMPKAQVVIDKQAARIAELQKDADRYRWLRERGDAFQWENILRFDLDECNYADNAQALDAAIDAAMEGSKGE